jgi:hypothetical protein
MSSWPFGATPTLVLDTALLALGAFLMLFGGLLARRHDARNDARIAAGTLDPFDAKPTPDYLKTGAIVFALGLLFTAPQFLK